MTTTNDLAQLMAASNAPQDVKEKALEMAISTAVATSTSQFGNVEAALGDGTFLKFLMELLKVLLPILLDLLKFIPVTDPS
jgi:hypothetical protein